MRIKGLTDEDFINYKLPSMVIATAYCDFKCGADLCQNSPLAKADPIDIDDDVIIRRYLNNPITKAIVFAGLEPFDQPIELFKFIYNFRHVYKCDDDIVIYSGYNKDEISERIEQLKKVKNIIVKYGRFIPGQKKHYDDVLGVYLASDNQYAEELHMINRS